MDASLSAAAAAVSGRLAGADVLFSGVSTDTRTLLPGQLFVALRGANFDAHHCLSQALAAGAAALMVDDPSHLPPGVSAVVVEDSRQALGRLAAAWRSRFKLPLIAVTGSNGKTTTKEMIAAIFRAAFGEAVLATCGNLNNEVGLPLTLLGLSAAHQAAVVEIGMSHPGEIAALTAIAAPSVAIVTNAQRAHLEGLGDLDQIAREKGALFQGLSTHGIAVINADDPHAALWRTQAAGRAQLSFGIEQPADLEGVLHPHGLESSMELFAPQGQTTLTLGVPGRHNALNALAAAAAALAAGISLKSIAAGLSGFSGVKGRLQRRAGRGGILLLDDSYNANPDSVRAGIDVLANTVGHKVLVLGDMGEIGEGGAQCHDEIGGYAKSQGIDRLLTLGEAAALAARNFGEGGRAFGEIERLLAALEVLLVPGTTVLVKGSRFMRMEQVADAISESVRCC